MAYSCLRLLSSIMTTGMIIEHISNLVLLAIRMWTLRGTCMCFKMGHVNNIPTMQFFTGISRNTQNLICYHWLSVFGNSKIMHCGILINMPSPIEIRCNDGSCVLALGKFWPIGDIVIPFFLDEIMGSNPRRDYPPAETIFRKLINISDPLWCSLK